MYSEYSDRELFELFREGREEPFEIVYERYKPRLYVFLRNLIPEIPPDEIGDIIQDIFLKVIEKATSFKKKHKFSTWIYTIARNKAYDYMRKRKRRKNPDPPVERTPKEKSIHREEWERVLSAVTRLPVEYREVVLLRSEGFSYREISKILFIPERVAITRMHRAVKKLKEELGNENF